MLGGFLDWLPDLDTMTALPVGPVPQPALAGAGAGGEGMTFTLTIGELNVTATNADPQEIAKAIVDGELARQVRALVEQVRQQGAGLNRRACQLHNTVDCPHGCRVPELPRY